MNHIFIKRFSALKLYFRFAPNKQNVNILRLNKNKFVSNHICMHVDILIMYYFISKVKRP